MDTLRQVGKPPHAYRSPDGSGVLVLPYGGRILGLFSIFPIYIAFFAVRENPEYQELPTPGLRQSFRIAAANKAFLIAVGIHLLTWIPIDLIQFVLVFLLSDYFGLSTDEVNIVFGLLFGTAILALPLWVWVSWSPSAHGWFGQVTVRRDPSEKRIYFSSLVANSTNWD